MGRKSRYIKKGLGEKNQVVVNYIHPCGRMEGCDGPVLQLYVGLDDGHGEVERRAVVRWFSNCVHIVVVCVLQVLLAGLTRGSVLPVY